MLLGADHCGTVQVGEVYDRGAWRTPVGDAPIDEELAAAIIAASPLLRSNPAAHSYEHSLEVQVPIVQVLLPRARIVPIAVPPAHTAVEIGTAVGKALAGRPTACVVGSTDLTHHAGHFPAPGGRGEAGVRWTVANDRRMIDLMESMAAERVIDEAERRGNACGAGAVAAAIAACRQMGAARGICLEYTNSYQVVHAAYPDDPDDTTVGYASVVFA